MTFYKERFQEVMWKTNLINLNQSVGTTRKILKIKFRLENKIKSYKFMALPTHLYGAVMVVTSANINKITAAQMRLLKAV